MQNNATAQKQSKFYSRFQLTLAISLIVALALLITAWFYPWVWHDPRPKPLGDRLEYIGKFDSGCAGFPCFGGGPPSATYYYATDMSMEEVGQYFQKATIHEITAESEFTSIWLHNNEQKKGFSIHYYKDTHMNEEEQRQLGLRQTSKHVLDVEASDYSLAQKSL